MTFGRIAFLLGLGAIVMGACVGVYVYLGQMGIRLSASAAGAGGEHAEQLLAEARRRITFVATLLVSALLVLLFVLGAYLVMRIGSFVSRERVGGKRTAYVDAWRSYRLTEEQISAATAEDKSEGGGRRGPVDPGEPPAGPEPKPPSES